MLSRYQARWADGRLEAVSRGVMWLGTGGWEGSAPQTSGGLRMLRWAACENGPTQRTTIQSLRSSTTSVRRIITSATVCGALFTSIAPQKTYSLSCATRRVCVQRSASSIVVLSCLGTRGPPQPPPPTAARRSTSHFSCESKA